jgi:hypothetical protein
MAYRMLTDPIDPWSGSGDLVLATHLTLERARTLLADVERGLEST